MISVHAALGINPQITAERNGDLAFVVVRTACYLNKGMIESRELEFKLIKHSDKNRATCYFAPSIEEMEDQLDK